MARTTTKAPAIEAKALAASSKSEGMRVLYEDGYTVAQVAKVFGIGYAFAYGVAKRGGFSDTAANRRPVKAAKTATKPAAKAAASKTTATAKVAAKVAKVADDGLTPGQRAYRARKAKAAVATTRPARSKAPVAKAAVKPGRPSPARRAANRAPRKA